MMRQTGMLVCASLLAAACVGPVARDGEGERPGPRTPPDLAPRLGSLEIAERAPAPRPDKPPLRKAEQDLAAGIAAYEDGDYKGAPRLIQGALDAGLVSNADKIAAHKYLAFMHCAQRRDKSCRDEFRKSLELEPKFELDAAEAGHPLWGPVFKSVKAELARKPQK